MKRKIIFVFLMVAATVAGNGETFAKKKKADPMAEVRQTIRQMEETSPFDLDKRRAALLEKIQIYSDSLPYTVFDEYLVSTDEKSVEMENQYPILYYYRYAFDKVIDEVRNAKVKEGSVAIWELYNMGFVVKTSEVCFGIDVNHRWDYMFEPYLDFLLVTHDHFDHKCIPLMDAMVKAGKPVLSNFYKGDAAHCSDVPAEYRLGDINIRTAITDHNAKLLDFISVFRIEMPGFTMIHSGDSNFRPEQFGNVEGPVDLIILRAGFEGDNNIFGSGPGQFTPPYAFLSHAIELRHRIGESPRRAPIPRILSCIPEIDCPNTVFPFWGEKMVWENGKLRK